MQCAAHITTNSLVDDLVLLHARLAFEGTRNNSGCIVVAVSSKIADVDLGVGERSLDAALDFDCVHGQCTTPQSSPAEAPVS